ncbi:hypothetical protein Nepgr_031229 [Nepenthes gracilis]|uniref:Uncharacterized protein n=1 Tax=Nepenthes gracilis TaxID=150966 RepID=A0AAD3Y7C4_NEPGR|nr:hypothetical protein Nepgr_031229 [Nepenthes gracilis]
MSQKRNIEFAKNILNGNSCRLDMAAKYIIPAVLGSFAVAYIRDHAIADKKIFGGTTPSTVSSKDWWNETDRKFQAWPRTAGPPVVMNPISRQNFIVKDTET